MRGALLTFVALSLSSYAGWSVVAGGREVLLLAAPIVGVALLWEPALVFPAALGVYFFYPTGTPSVIAGSMAVLVGVGWVLSALQGREVLPRVGHFALLAPLTLVGLWQVLSRSEGNEVAARYTAVLAGIGLVYVVSGLRAARRAQAVTVFASVFALVVAEAALGALQSLTASPLWAAPLLPSFTATASEAIPGLFRATGTFAHPNALAVTLVLSFPFVMWLRTFVRPSHSKLVSVGAMVIFVGVFASLSRGAIVAMAMLVLAWLYNNRGRWSLKRTAILFFVVGVSVLMLWSGPFARLSAGVASRDAGSNAARTTNMAAALEAWSAEPLLGNGFGRGAIFGQVFGGYEGLGAHNTYLDVLAGGGVVLALLFAVASWRLLRISQWAGALRYVPVVIGTLGMFESLIQSGAAVVIGGLAGTITYASTLRHSEQQIESTYASA